MCQGSLSRAAVLILLFCGHWAATASGAQRPNVILVLTDDQGYGDVAAHGNTMIRTPNLDALHERSVRLTDFHVSPCCTPTRAALMTGRDPLRVGAWGTTWGRSLPYAEETMMAQVFARSGYRTGFFGKWHLGDNFPFRPGDRGFHTVLCHGGGGVGQTPDYWGNDYFDDTYFVDGRPTKFSGYCTDIWFDGAMEFIEANRQQPFFVYLSTNAPHGPLNVDPKYSDPYVEQGVPAAMAKFYGMIENIDENMGRLVALLESLDLAENTILIFMTDNGTASGVLPANQTGWTGFNAGMRGKKGSLYDGGHRVPCFLRWPQGELGEGRDIDRLTAHVDILPTLIDLCGLNSPEDVTFDGTSLVPLLRGDTRVWPDRALFVQYRQSTQPPIKWAATLMTEQWRLVNGEKLYDMNADPGQLTDVAAGHVELVGQLRAEYDAWWADVSSRFDEYSPIVLGAAAENPARLTSFDWHTNTPWNQGHIRAGAAINGFWAVRVAQQGEYRISLRRWPPEVDAPITGSIDGGKAIRATEARLVVGDVERTKPIPSGAAAVTFDVQLDAGQMTLQTWLVDTASGESRGAYYVEVLRRE